MKRKLSIFLALVMILAISLCLSACGNTTTEVPDAKIQELVNRFEYSTYGDPIWNATHHVDSSTHTDKVDISLTIECEYGEILTSCSATFEYDRSSDLWSLQSKDDWTEPTYTYNDNLIRQWSIDYYGSLYDINVTAVSSNTISADYIINEKLYAGLSDSGNFVTTGSGTFQFYDIVFEIPVELPDELYVSWKDTDSGENESVTTLHVMLSPYEGIYSAYIDPRVYVK